MSRNRRTVATSASASAGVGRELVEYRHSYHHFLSVHLPQYLPPPSNVPPPPPPPPLWPGCGARRSPVGEDVDLHRLGLDPTNWKKQDHYLLLGLHDRRHKATAAEIKAAYRQRVLRYHPDKIQQASGTAEDNIFKCIFHAYQVLSDPEKRKQYDSVDARSFDESIPPEDAVPPGDIDTFLAIYRPVFLRNARFSKKEPVPDLGHPFSPREDVEAFYAFWSTFESWRSFDYLDEDESDNAENRADKRWLEKKNKANRQKRKNEDNARLRRLFEQAYKLDPRMIRFREDDRLRKEAIKMEKEMAALRLAQERERERQEKEELVRIEREKAAHQEALAKRQKDEAEAKLRREKRAFKKIFVDNLYFVSEKTNVALINERSILLEKLILRIADFAPWLNQVTARKDRQESDSIMTWIEEQYQALLAQEASAATKKDAGPRAPLGRGAEADDADKADDAIPWTLPELDTLINAIKTHPGGLRDRWTRITEWYNRHISHLDKTLPARSQDDLIRRASEIRQTTDEGQASVVLPSEATTDYRALQRKRDPRIDQAEPTIVVSSVSSTGTTSSTTTTTTAWTAEEQKRLEQGLKIHRADDPSRWDKIAEFVRRPKKDCMLRAKEIAQLLKQKKAAVSQP